MKMHLYLISLVLSTAAWGAAPATGTTPAADSSMPATQVATPAPTTTPAPMATPMPTASKIQTSPAPTAESGFSRGSVVRSVFTSGIKDKEPIDKLSGGKTHDSRVFYFTELRDMSGQTAVHRWEHNGKVVAEVKFKVRGPRWRVWSSKTFMPDATGEWKVYVLNGAGEVIAEDMIDYEGPAPEQKPTPSAAEPAQTEPAAATSQPAATQPATSPAPSAQQPMNTPSK